MSKPSNSKPKPTQSFMSTPPNPLPSPKKQFPSISLSKHLQQYKAYRSIQGRKKYPDTDKNNSYMISPEERSILMNRNLDMPSIHAANLMSEIGEVFNCTKNSLQKWQQRILKSLTGVKKEEEWRLYMTKSELVQDKTSEFEEIQEFLLKFISRCLEKTLLSTTVTQFCKDYSQRQNYGSGQQSTQNKMNKTFNSFLQRGVKTHLTTGNGKKITQPSLKVLKEQLTTLGQQKDNSFNEMSNSRTAVNFRQDNNNRSTIVEAKYEEELNKMTFERSLLEKKLELYQCRINFLQRRLKEQNISIEQQDMSPSLFGQPSPFPTKTHKLSPIQQQLMNNLINQNKYKSQAQFKKIQNQTLMKQLSIIKEHSFKLKIDNQKLVKQLEQLQEECNKCREFKKYRQLWLMQCEETIGWKNLWRERKDQTVKLTNKIKILKEKNKQLLHSFNFSMVVNPDQQQDKQELENIIKGFQEWLKVMSVPRVNCPLLDPKQLMDDMGSVKEHQYMPDPQNVNYKLLKPNFFIFFQAYEKTIMMEKNILNTRPLQPTFFVKIRAILDSMYNHFNSYANYKYWTSFPEFTIGFLEKYEVSFTTLKIQPRKKPMPSEEKLTFLMNLFNKKLSNTWECDMFRSFILEEYTLDEIYFFLDCRNDLNGGMTLTHGFGSIDPVSYVKLHKALATAQRKLSPYENYIIQRVKTILKSRRKQKNNEPFIDSNFVLKLLLEVYSLEKTKSQRVFQASFKSKPTSKRQVITYSDFFAFMNKNFDFLTTIDICQLYRETYALSSGKITHKAVHYVCQSRGLFIPLIWAKRLNMNVLDKSLNSDMILLDLQNNVRKMNGCLGEMGVEEVARLENDLNYFLRQVDWYRNNRQVFYFKMQEIKTRIIKANCILDWQASTYTPNQLLSTDEIRQGIMQIHSLIHQSDSSIKLLIKKKDDKERAIKQITKNFKIRIQESMQEFRRIDDEQLKKLKNEMALEIKNRKQREQQEKQQEENENKQNNRISQLIEEEKQKKSILGNSFVNVTDMLRNQINGTMATQARANIEKDSLSIEQNKTPSNKSIFQARKPSKLLTIQESNQNQS